MSSRLHHSILFGNLLLVALLLTACNDKPTGEVTVSSQKEKEKKESPFISGNQKILKWETEEMELFIKRYEWKMQKTGTGLYIQILDPGKGDFYKEGDDVTLAYQTFTLDGELIYDSKNDGEKQFRVERSEEIPALHEAVKLLKPGAKARLVIPSYLAYGVAGDGNSINGRKAIAMIVEMKK